MKITGKTDRIKINNKSEIGNFHAAIEDMAT